MGKARDLANLLADGAVGTTEIADSAVTTGKINNGAVSFAKLLPSDWTASSAANGYQRLPSGLIIQWGEISFTGSHGATYSPTFPIAFPSATRQVLGYVTNTVSTTTQTPILCPLTAITNSGFTFQYGANNGASYATTLRWFAIGV